MARWTELALAAATAKRTQDRVGGNFAMSELAPVAVRTARRIHATYASLRRQRAADFVAMAPTLVWNKVEKFEQWYFGKLSDAQRADPTKDWFSAWCYTELHYRYLDQGRDQADEQVTYSLSPGGGDAIGGYHPAGANDGGDDDAGGFALTGEDLARVRGWGALDGVILFCLTGQWDKVPADLWSAWLAELDLRPPFPPVHYLQAPRTKKRAVLASLLHVSRDVIYQRWLRLKRKVHQERGRPSQEQKTSRRPLPIA